MPKPEYKASSGAGEYGDFVQQVDASVGAILKKLDQMGFSKNTLVIFTSDNGPYWRPDYIERFHHQSAGEFRGMKGDAFEGGHRVPFLVRWPGTIQAASQSSATISLTNLMATVAEITGKKSTGEDSYSILPVLQGKANVVAGQPAVVVSSSTGYFSIRQGDWKLIEGLGSGGFTEPKEIKQSQEGVNGQLFNLALDPKETQDVFSTNPQKVAELRALLQEIKKYPKK
jgi:arylsulfatase A-like enzyme